LLETVRQYGLEALAEDGQESVLRERHRRYWHNFIEETLPSRKDESHAPWFDRLEAEQDNLRAALDWSDGSHSCAMERLHLATNITIFWLFRGHLREGRERLECLLRESMEAPQALRGRALIFVGWIAYFQGEFDSLRDAIEAGIDLSREAGDGFHVALALNVRAMGALNEGAIEWASALSAESLNIARQIGSKWLIQFALHVLGSSQYMLGNLADAASSLKESIAVAWEMNDGLCAAYSIYMLGEVERSRRHWVEARRLQCEALSLFRDARDERGTASCLEAFGSLARAAGQNDRAAALFGAAHALRESVGAPTGTYDQPDLDESKARAESALGAETFRAFWTRGRKMTLEQIIQYALKDEAA
jgi:non-specific serine/threonine protein kinase